MNRTSTVQYGTQYSSTAQYSRTDRCKMNSHYLVIRSRDQFQKALRSKSLRQMRRDAPSSGSTPSRTATGPAQPYPNALNPFARPHSSQSHKRFSASRAGAAPIRSSVQSHLPTPTLSPMLSSRGRPSSTLAAPSRGNLRSDALRLAAPQPSLTISLAASSGREVGVVAMDYTTVRPAAATVFIAAIYRLLTPPSLQAESYA